MRRLTLVIVPALVLLLLGSVFAAFWSELPEPMAIHWGLNGEPNGSAPRLVAFGLLAAIHVAVAVAVYQSVRRSPGEGPSFTAGLFGISALLLGVALLMVSANQGRGDWRQADEVGLLQVLVLLLVGFLFGTLGWVVAGGRAASTRAEPGTLPRLDVAEPASSIWSGRGFGKVTTAIGVAVIAAGLLVWGWSGIVLVLVGIVALLFSAVRVTVSGERLVVSLGWLGYPSWRVPLATVARAEVERVNPMAYGGWGYRIRPGVRAVVIRSGDALRIVRDEGPDLLYTVDDAERGAGLINSIVSARSE
ncbi:MAG: DUF1648 domain-containing protein [Acidimicrobiia bacterium]|nr:DUF1648 domain-containing protein [Acidimicrobiia bacterium]